MRIKTKDWMRRYNVANLDTVQFSATPRSENDERPSNYGQPDDERFMEQPVHLQCDGCEKHARFSDEVPHEGSGWTQGKPQNDQYAPDESPLFEVDLCAECSQERDVAEFDHLPRTGCEWCWKRMPKDQLRRAEAFKDGRPGIETICTGCAAKVKRCRKCEQLHSKDDFAADKKSRDGRDYTCKFCRAASRQTPEARARDAARKRAERSA